MSNEENLGQGAFGHTCYYHEDISPVGKCETCGRNLCRKCFDKYNGKFCEHDIAVHHAYEYVTAKKDIKLFLIGCAVGGVLDILILIFYNDFFGDNDSFGDKVLTLLTCIYSFGGVFLCFRVVLSRFGGKSIIATLICLFIADLFVGIGGFIWYPPFRLIKAIIVIRREKERY
ncbi:MAG: hypothetical protein LBT30_00045 [Clostridiales bacterium]|jgi:hypothetical protein|nr:hypothetical protein [Clostridiales bacterium]